MHGSKYVACRPSLTLGMGSIGQTSTFSKPGNIAYQIKMNHKMQQHGSKFFARKPRPDPSVGVKSQNQTFSEHGLAAYQMKENNECSSTETIIMPTYPSLDLGMGSIGQVFAETWSCCILSN